METTSASSIQKSFTYDVFLSFRGEDTRTNFVDHLYLALHQKDIKTYKDDVTINKGERIGEQLIKSIQDSRFHIIVFSKNYASSSWCLDELVKIMECEKTKEQTAYPVFYDVEPTEVRHQSGPFEEAFAKHVDEEAVGRWRDALKDAANLAGWELKKTVDGHEAKFIQQIVNDISKKLNFIYLSVYEENLVGMETRVRNVVSSLEIDSDVVRMIGIKGMGGGGKTTLARAVFYQIYTEFEGTSFVENVREVAKDSLSGLKKLQKHVLKDVSNDPNIDVLSISDGKDKMIKMMSGRKVLVVLDDVDSLVQLAALAGMRSWFKAGSRIIITTRDEQVLVSHGVHRNDIHDVNLLSNEEAICLLSRHAFGTETPIEGYEEQSRQIIHYAAGLPLTVMVLGSSLCNKTVVEWDDYIERLKTIPEKETLQRLELSYIGLEDDHKDIFLDVACLMKGVSKDEAIRSLESCGFHAQFGLKVLEQKSLISISSAGHLRMHDHIEEMGMNIVRHLHPHEPEKHNRLWIEEEIENILVHKLGTEETLGMKLMYTHLHPTIIMEGLRKMKKLRFLYVSNSYRKWTIDKVGNYLPNALQSVHWHGYPFSCLPKTFEANKLVNLEMESSNISQLWELGERKVLYKLRFLNLKYSKLRTFDLRFTPHLERLDLRGCDDFEELHMKSKSPKLKVLNLSGSKVSKLDLEKTLNLEWLDLEQCNCLLDIYAPAGCLKNIVYINLIGCLRFKYFFLDKRHESVGLDSVPTLELTAESLDICPLHPNSNLPKLQFDCKYDEPRGWSGNLEKLISFGLCACTDLSTYSASICGLRRLRVITLEGSIPEVHKNMYQLESVEKLTLSIKNIKHLPDSICRLEHLKYLDLKSCWLLEQLPKVLGRLESLEKLDLTDCISLQDIPSSICNIKRLTYLLLPYCSLVEKLPEELGRLVCLKELNIEGTSITHLPHSIFQLKGLCIVWSRGRLESYGFGSIKEVSRYTASAYVYSCF